MNRTIASLLLAFPVLALATGCGLRKDTDEPTDGEVTSEEQALVADGSEMEVAHRQATMLTAVPTLAIAGGVHRTADDAASAQGEAPSYFQPEGCLMVTQIANVVTYVFDGCTGPWGLVEIDGVETATFRAGEEEGSIAIELESHDMTLNGTPIEHQADVLVTFPDGGRRVVWKGGFDGTTPNGRDFQHTSDVVLELDAEGCRTVNGTTSGSIGERSLTTVYEEVTRCGSDATCPSGTITCTNAKGLSVELALDGTDEAILTGPRGREHSIDLECTPVE